MSRPFQIAKYNPRHKPSDGLRQLLRWEKLKRRDFQIFRQILKNANQIN